MESREAIPEPIVQVEPCNEVVASSEEPGCSGDRMPSETLSAVGAVDSDERDLDIPTFGGIECSRCERLVRENRQVKNQVKALREKLTTKRQALKNIERTGKSSVSYKVLFCISLGCR